MSDMASPVPTTGDRKRWTLGIDVGDRSIGLSAVAFDEAGPTEILAAVSVIHDGGVGDPKTKKSRLSQAGVARRIRRLRRRRRARLRAVDELVREFAWVVPSGSGGHPYAAWQARKRLVEEKIADPDERSVLLGQAITHLARHRGWRNPWLSTAALSRAEVPSKGLVDAVQAVEERFGIRLKPGTIGQIGAVLSKHPGLRVNPGKAVKGESSLLHTRARQEDLRWELHLIAERQGICAEHLEKLEEVIFRQRTPHVPAERIGKDPLDPDQLRAPVASLEFQEFRIRDKVANLRIRTSNGPRPLTKEERDCVVEELLRTKEPLTWTEVALDLLHLERESDLVIPEEGSHSNHAPRDHTTAALEAHLESKGESLVSIRQWWEQADRAERAALVRLLLDPKAADEFDLCEGIPDTELEELVAVSLPAGRAAYGYQTLQTLNEAMAGSELDCHGAIKDRFRVGDDWRPPLPGLDEPTGHPTVDRNLAAVRKFLSSAELRWGPPSRIVVELAREGEKTPRKLAEEKNKRMQRRSANDKLREELKGSGVDKPRPADLMRHRLVSLYGNQCLYCGDPITWNDAELDHIVPRADGGSNRMENLAAVCLSCNRAKGRRPFGLWAEEGGADLKAVIARVNSLSFKEGGPWSSERALNAYRRAVVSRLRRMSEDPEEERSIASTSYAATALADRLTWYAQQCGLDRFKAVSVFSGGITAEARFVLDISVPKLCGREGSSKRLDRRHHAIDACVLTTLRPAVAQLLAKRRVAREAQEFFRGRDEVDLRSWEGQATGSQPYKEWLSAGQELCRLLKAALDKDKVALIRPLRLRPSGQLHDETVRPFVFHRIGDPWTEDEVRRVVEPSTYLSLRTLFTGAATGLLKDMERRVMIDEGKELGPDCLVRLFPDGHAMMKATTGAVNMGSVHHARLYAWKNKKGNYEFAMLRVFLADLAVCGLLRPGVDVFTAELPEWSQSRRYAADNLRKAVDRGAAAYLGWLAPNDELEFPSTKVIPASGNIRSFLKYFPERHWYVRSFEEPSRVRLGASYLAEEGLNGGTCLSKDVVTVIKRGWRPAIGVLFGCQDLLVVRRTALGTPRWEKTDANLPISWYPWQRAAEVLG